MIFQVRSGRTHLRIFCRRQTLSVTPYGSMGWSAPTGHSRSVYTLHTSTSQRRAGCPHGYRCPVSTDARQRSTPRRQDRDAHLRRTPTSRAATHGSTVRLAGSAVTLTCTGLHPAVPGRVAAPHSISAAMGHAATLHLTSALSRPHTPVWGY